MAARRQALHHPGRRVYLFPTLIALGFAVYVIFLNFRGASSAAKLQAFLTKALLCGMLLAMGVSLFTGSPDNAMPVFSQVTGAGGGKAATESTSCSPASCRSWY